MPGISVSKIPIPFPGGGGVNWVNFWASLISATVENAAPTHVVLTFSAAQTGLGASDFTIPGFTISSASWTGAVLTLVLSEAVIIFDGNLTVIFITTGATAVVTNNVADDSHTVFWFDNQDLATITKDVNNKVSAWADKLGSGHDLLQATGGYQPTWSADGIFFPNGGQYKMKTAPFLWNQPVMVYAFVKPLNWTNMRALFDGNGQESTLVEQYQSTPGILNYAGAIPTRNDNLILNTWGIIRVLFSGVNSKLQINDTAATTGNAGAQNAGGFTLGNTGGGNTRGSEGQFKEIIGRNVADSAGIEAAIYDYLAMHNRTEIEMFLSFITGGTRVEWIDADNTKYPCDAYEIWVSANGGAYSLLDTVVGTETTYDDFVGYGTSYTHYKVRARRGNSFCEFSDAHTITADLVFTLTSHGDGSGVAALCFETSETVTMTLTGTARFYSDAAGTLDESPTAVITVGALRTFYVKAPSGTATLTVKNRIIKWGNNHTGVDTEIPDGVNTGWFTPQVRPNPFTYPNISIDASTMGHNTSFNIYGCNTIYGNISGLPITYLEIGNGYTAGSWFDPAAQPGEGCSITGDIARFTDLECLDVWDKIHLTGAIGGCTKLKIIWMSSLSQITGSVNPLTDLRWFQPNAYTAHALTGSLSGCTMLYLISYSSDYCAVTIANATNLTRLAYLELISVWSAANTNQLLADMVANMGAAKPVATRYIKIDGTPSGQGVTDKNTLIAAGWTVTTN